MGEPREPARSGAEQDVVADRGHWRRAYCYLRGSRVTSGIKRQIRRRERHKAKRALGEETSG